MGHKTTLAELIGLKSRKKLCDLWKQGQALQEECRAVVCVSRENTQKAKAQLESKMTSVVSESKKLFFEYIDNKRRSKINTGPMLVKDCHLINKD